MVSSWVYVGYWHDAITLFERAFAVTEANPTLHFNLGILHERQDLYDKSIAHYRKAIDIRPLDHRMHNNLAITLYWAGRYREAWKEAHICEDLGKPMKEAFIRDLSAAMSDPGK